MQPPIKKSRLKAISYIKLRACQTIKLGRLFSVRRCITSANFRLAKLEKSGVYSGVNEHFESERNDKVALLDSFFYHLCSVEEQ